MALISISGIGRKKPKQAKAQTKAQKKAVVQKKIAVKKAKVQAKKKVVLAKIKKVGKVAVKYNPLVATARNAFLALVSLNVFNLAKRLNMMLVKNPKKLMDFWTKLSGKFSALQNSINTGKNKKAIVGAVAVATTITTATPILIKVMKFLEENGISKDDIKKAVNVVVAKAIDKKITQEAVKEVEEEEAKAEEEETSQETSEEISEEAPKETSEETTEESNTDNEQIGYYC
jgi:hypothetical protein